MRISFRVEEDDDGVRTGDWPASLDPTEFGDAVPSFVSLFFLEDLLPLRWSCVCGTVSKHSSSQKAIDGLQLATATDSKKFNARFDLRLSD